MMGTPLQIQVGVGGSLLVLNETLAGSSLIASDGVGGKPCPEGLEAHDSGLLSRVGEDGLVKYGFFGEPAHCLFFSLEGTVSVLIRVFDEGVSGSQVQCS